MLKLFWAILRHNVIQLKKFFGSNSDAKPLTLRSVAKALASIKLAVVIIVALGTMTAWGTFVEAKYNDAEAASKMVYNSPLMYAIMAVFAINLIAVMIDRLPWRERHVGFILAHIGLLLLMLGAIMTKYMGVDGSMTIALGETSKQIVTGETDLTLYSSMDASRYTKVDDREVDFFRHRPSADKPYELMMPQGTLRVIKFFPYALRDQKIVASGDNQSGGALRFQIQNQFVNQTEWVLQPGPGRPAVKDFGPAQIIFGTAGDVDPTRNSIVLIPEAGDGDKIKYEVHSAKDPKNVKKGVVTAGDTIETGWMGALVLRVLKYIPHAKEQITFNEIDQSTPLTTSAILVEFQRTATEVKTQHWIALNSMLKLFTDQAVYILAFANRRLNLDFNIKLDKFHVGRYEGTMTASSYESKVNLTRLIDGKVLELGEHTISMNEPLKHSGFTFYQSSFSEDERGMPTASVLSVNRDPGRWVKYLGCLLIVFGSIHLFYFKRRSRVKPSPAAQFPVAP